MLGIFYFTCGKKKIQTPDILYKELGLPITDFFLFQLIIFLMHYSLSAETNYNLFTSQK